VLPRARQPRQANCPAASQSCPGAAARRPRDAHAGAASRSASSGSRRASLSKGVAKVCFLCGWPTTAHPRRSTSRSPRPVWSPADRHRSKGGDGADPSRHVLDGRSRPRAEIANLGLRGDQGRQRDRAFDPSIALLVFGLVLAPLLCDLGARFPHSAARGDVRYRALPLRPPSTQSRHRTD